MRHYPRLLVTVFSFRSSTKLLIAFGYREHFLEFSKEIPGSILREIEVAARMAGSGTEGNHDALIIRSTAIDLDFLAAKGCLAITKERVQPGHYLANLAERHAKSKTVVIYAKETRLMTFACFRMPLAHV
jgi:hypothetical protein